MAGLVLLVAVVDRMLKWYAVDGLNIDRCVMLRGRQRLARIVEAAVTHAQVDSVGGKQQDRRRC
jgi:hypothetical protein